MNNFETKIVVSETKGLLRTLENDIKGVRYDLAFDNLNELPEKLQDLRKLIDVIEEKITKNCDTETETDELY